MKCDSEGMELIYATKVEPKEILYVVKEMTHLHDSNQKPDFYSAVFILSQRYKGQKDATQKSFVIMERLQCLAKLMEKRDERMRGWTLQAIDPGCMLTDTAMFTATALCPLKRDGNEMCFDPDEFFEIVLRECEVAGRG